MADDEVVDLRVLGRQFVDLRLRLGRIEGRQNEQGRDIKLLLVMVQNLGEALQDMNRQYGELLGTFNTRLGALEAGNE
jgi:hypothetical protein